MRSMGILRLLALLWPMLGGLPLAGLLVRDADGVLVLALTPVLGLAWVALAHLALGVLPGRWLTGAGSLGCGLSLLVAASLSARHRSARRGMLAAKVSASRFLSGLFGEQSASLLRWVVLVSFAVGTWMALTFPFLRWDYLARYAHTARDLATDGCLTHRVSGYPPLVPLGYLYTFLICGQTEDYLSKLVNIGYNFSFLCATAALARELAGQRTALCAVALLSLMPVVNETYPSGNLDTALTSLVTLFLIFLLRLERTGSRRDVVGACLTGGLALWAKQAALTILASAAGYAILVYILEKCASVRTSRTRPVSFLLVVAVALLLASPWYGRNLVLTGVPAPESRAPTDWMNTNRSLQALVPYSAYSEEFGYAPAVILGLGNLYLLLILFRRGSDHAPRVLLPLALALLAGPSLLGHLRGRPLPPVDQHARLLGAGLLFALGFLDLPGIRVNRRALLLASGLLPHLLIWWWSFSFYGRYLLPILPLVSVLGVLSLRLFLRPFRHAGTPFALLLAMLLALAVEENRLAVAQFTASLKLPFSDAIRREYYLKGLWTVVLRLREEEARRPITVLAFDTRVPYLLDRATVATGAPQADWGKFDYLVGSPGGGATDQEQKLLLAPPQDAVLRAGLFSPVLTDRGYTLYRRR
jgi:4-amino-4-deoxy-L-arabinose transferase-like glycosyltransferase